MTALPKGALRAAFNSRQKNARRAVLLDRCRELMEAGNFRPTVAEITGAGGVHHVTNLFGSIAALWEQALDDDTVKRIAQLVEKNPHRIARAAVFGRLST